MRRVHLAELRGSWPSWLGVSLSFVTISFALALSALVAISSSNAGAAGRISEQASFGMAFVGWQNLVLSALTALSVVGSSTALVVESRRGSLARLAISGATPGQVRGTVMTQLVAVTLASAIVGDLLAVAVLRPVLAYLFLRPGEDPRMPEPAYDLGAMMLATVVGVVIALVGGYRQATLAARVPAVEALREAASGPPEGRYMSRLRWTGAAVTAVVVLGTFVAVPLAARTAGKEAMSILLTASLFMLPVFGMLLALLAPVIVRPVTRAWTALLPVPSPSWALARRTVTARAGRFAKSVIPVMMTVGLMFGLMAITSTLNVLLHQVLGYELENLGYDSLMTLLGLPLAISIAGGVGSIVMMSKQREAELALTGVVGATPAQRVLMPVLEGLIVTVTATILGVVMMAVSLTLLAIGVSVTKFTFGLDIPWPSLTLAAGSCALVTVAATTLPTLASLRLPEPKVIARLVAE